MDLSTIAGNRAATGANLAATQANLATTGQDMGYKDASAMGAVGNQQDQFAQRNLDALNAQWQAQRDFQPNTLNQAAAFNNSLNGGASYNVNQPSQYPYGMSPMNAANTGNAIGMSTWGGYRRGGLAMAQGGLVRRPIPEWLREALEAAA